MKYFKVKSYLLVSALSIFLFTSCGNEKSNNDVEEAEKIEMEANEIAEAEKAEAEKKAKEEEMKMEARSNSIAAKAEANDELITLTSALKATELDATLAEPGTYTVFAPSENAFSKLPEGTIDNLMIEENKESLKKILQYHVVNGKITSDKLVEAIKGGGGKYNFNTINGNALIASMDGSQIVIEDSRGKKAHVILGNVDASNGIIHIIDNVLMEKK